ncbi:sacsin N-terminal ATP-binding-like domain-containing protein [Nannocystis pusilla]|uniref:sacsin N-terminal ATP-binding-like domain-containing protein n=1 Tax=Nannocystis pusilla TaxID=889268 RepID=UPI003B761295
MKDARQEVEKILESRNRQDANAADLARSLVKLSKELYGQEDRFIYELLQNANDSAKNGAKVQVAFTVVGGCWLVVSHDGKGFNNADVLGLTSVGLSSDKRENADAIGYKGIGFKSVFAVSEWVCIQSNDYRFRFDRSRWPSPSTTPWQILPIWTEPTHVPEPVREQLAACTERVAFAIRMRDDFDVFACLQGVFKNPNILLFLTHVSAIELALRTPHRLERQVNGQEIRSIKTARSLAAGSPGPSPSRCRLTSSRNWRRTRTTRRNCAARPVRASPLPPRWT